MKGIENNRKVLGKGIFFFFVGRWGTGRRQCVCNKGFVSCVTIEPHRKNVIVRWREKELGHF